MPLGSVISAVSNIIGGGINAREAAANRAAQMQIHYDNINLQKDFATSGVRWKVEDAKRAGVHPLYALGAQTHSFTPQSVSFGSSGAGDAFARAGQDIGRAVDATRTAGEREFVRAQQGLTLENMSLQNQLLASQIARLQANNNPPMAGGEFAIPGQVQSGLVKRSPQEAVVINPAAPYAEPGTVSDVGYTRTGTGGLAPVYSDEAKQRLEDDFLGMLAWNIRNRLLPTVGVYDNRPDLKPEAGRWEWNPLRQEYVWRKGDYHQRARFHERWQGERR